MTTRITYIYKISKEMISNRMTTTENYLSNVFHYRVGPIRITIDGHALNWFRST